MSKASQPAENGGKYYDTDSHQWMTPEQEEPIPNNEGSEAPATEDED